MCRYWRACKNYAAFHNGKLLRGNEQWGLLSGWIVSNQIHIWRWIVEYFPSILESPWVSYFSLVNTWERKRWWTSILFLFYLIETLPTGYAFDAIDRAKVHRLKVPPHAMGETCFDKVYEDMLGFLKENYTSQLDENGRELPMAIFTHDIHMKMIKSILSQLPQRPDDVQHDVDVLSLNMLFNQLKNIDAPDANTRISIHVSNMLMDADRYDAASNIACNYHEENDGALQCAMSICRRWFYTFCDHVCAKLGVTLVSGVHLPDNSDCNRNRRGGDSKKSREVVEKWMNSMEYWLLIAFRNELSKPNVWILPIYLNHLIHIWFTWCVLCRIFGLLVSPFIYSKWKPTKMWNLILDIWSNNNNIHGEYKHTIMKLLLTQLQAWSGFVCPRFHSCFNQGTSHQ